MKKRTKEILELIDGVYGTDVKCYLTHQTPEQLLIATMLSAQCTDARVNMVTPGLFEKYPDMQAFAAADISELEDCIHSVGFYHAKARNIIGCAKMICEKHGGKVPDNIEDLTQLPGVGRKTANVVLGNVFGVPGIVVDTHVKRISKRLGFTDESDPEKVEYDLMKVLPKDHWIIYNMQIITFGRQICFARNPKCENCFLTAYCREYKSKGTARKV